ncbi:MAG: dockerin type I domain-containing protein [Planctomycetota bacterium]
MPQPFSTRALIAGAALCLTASPALTTAQAQLRIVSWNPNGGPRPGADVVLEAIGDDNVNGIARPIDILFLQEQSAAENFAYAALLNDIYNTDRYEIGFFVGATTFAGTGGASTVYNSETVDLISQTQAIGASSSGAPRAPVENRFRPLGYDAAADAYAYNSHYKAGTGGSNEARRLIEATAIRALSDTRGQGTHAIYLGDFNMRSSFEGAYQELLSPGPGQAFDPLNRPGNWNNNSSFADIHTQSPASGGGGLTTGGVDDRFDFQLTTAEVLDGEGFDLIPGSYRAFGNDGQSFNQAINVDRFGREYPLNVLDALATAGDHLPVVVDYQIPAIQSVALDTAPTLVLAGTPVALDVSVSNAAPVATANGADELDYSVTTTGDVSGAFLNQTDNATGGANTHAVNLDTATTGAKSGAVNVNSTSQAVQNGNFSENVDFTVVNSAQGSFDAGTVQDTLVIDFGVLGQTPGGSASETFDVFNLGGAFTAGLDLLSFAPGVSGPFSSLGSFADLAAGGSQSLQINLDLSNTGTFSTSFTLDLADHAGVFGAADLADLTVQVLATVGDPILVGDANDDGVVDLLDFDILSDNFNSTVIGGVGDGDFNGDGQVNLLDFALLADNFGASAPSTVPEPASAALLALAAPALIRRRRA